MQPVETHFDLYFDTLNHFMKQGFSYKIGITPPDFHRAIRQIRKRSVNALNAGKATYTQIDQWEKKKVYELIKNSHNYSECIEYYLESSREIVILHFVDIYDGISIMTRKTCREFARKYHPCYRLMIVDFNDAKDLAQEYMIRNLPTTVFFYNNQIVGKLHGFIAFQHLEKCIDSIYAKADILPCEVRQELI